MASPPSQKRQKLSASSTSPSTLPPEPAVTQSPAPPQPAPTPTHLSTLPPPPPNAKKRRASQIAEAELAGSPSRPSGPGEGSSSATTDATTSTNAPPIQPAPEEGTRKKGRTNIPWTAAEEQRLKTMRDAGKSWGEIAKAFPSRTEGSVKKHWYKDMHYAEFGEDEKTALRDAIREYDANKWKVIGQKVGKPAKACEQFAKENFRNV